MLIINLVRSQVGPPDLRCLATSTNGDITLTWIPPADPGSQFFSYEIFHSALQAGPFTSVGTVSPINASSFIHVGAGGNIQSQYYFVVTHYGAGGTSTSPGSDTLRSIFLNLFDPHNGTANISYNQLHQPPLATSVSNFSILREYPVGTWSNLLSTSNLSFIDTIAICTVAYNYQIVLGDNSGCLSVSNIDGGIFHDKIGPSPIYIDSLSVLPNGETVIGYPASTSNDCTGYYIYQQITTNLNTQIDSLNGKNNTIYTFTSSAATNSSVVFVVAPFDSCGNPGILDNPHQTMLLNHSYDKCKYQTQLSWSAYVGWTSVSEYRIYYSVNGGNYQYLGSTNQTAYTHTGVDPSKTVSYYVRAFNETKTFTSSSNRVNFFTFQTVGPDFIYIRSVSVKDDNTIKVRLYVDSLKLGNGFDLYRSDDGSSFNKIAFINSNGTGNYEYTDPSRNTRSQSYFYKAIAKDSCGNDRTTSSIVQSILLKVNNQKDNMFHKNLSWNNYTGFAGGIAGYNIYRVVNDVVSQTPSAYTNGPLNQYTDDIEDLAPEGSKIEYFVSAVEGLGNPYGITETANSNLATTYIEADVFVPSAFAPNGVNKIWKPVTQFVDKSEYNLKIYNRWGNLLFETSDDSVGWTGNGAPNDEYVYFINYKNGRGEYIQMKGTFTLL